MLFDTGLSNILGGGALSPEARKTKAKIHKWHYIKLKSFCTGKKKAINKTKNWPTEWQKIFANDISDKELIFKNSYNSTSNKNKKQKNLI